MATRLRNQVRAALQHNTLPNRMGKPGHSSDAAICVLIEDSPSDTRTGVASGPTAVARVFTSHERARIENCVMHFIVDMGGQGGAVVSGVFLHLVYIWCRECDSIQTGYALGI